MRRRLQDSPLMAQLRLGLGGLQPPSPVPVSERDISEPDKLAFCELLLEATGRAMCNNLVCRSCEYLTRRVDDEDTRWLCSACAIGKRSHRYWSDGKCESCGDYSIVLTLTQAE